MKTQLAGGSLDAACVFTSRAEDLNLVGLLKSNSSYQSGRDLNPGLLYCCESNVLTAYLYIVPKEKKTHPADCILSLILATRKSPFSSC